jgi:hypothetical protein
MELAERREVTQLRPHIAGHLDALQIEMLEMLLELLSPPDPARLRENGRGKGLP